MRYSSVSVLFAVGAVVGVLSGCTPAPVGWYRYVNSDGAAFDLQASAIRLTDNYECLNPSMCSVNDARRHCAELGARLPTFVEEWTALWSGQLITVDYVTDADGSIITFGNHDNDDDPHFVFERLKGQPGRQPSTFVRCARDASDAQ